MNDVALVVFLVFAQRERERESARLRVFVCGREFCRRRRRRRESVCVRVCVRVFFNFLSRRVENTRKHTRFFLTREKDEKNEEEKKKRKKKIHKTQTETDRQTDA